MSIWITPSGSPSVPIIGAQIIERIEKSAMLWAMLNRSSLAASAERIAFLDFIASSTIVRLIRIRSSSPVAAILDRHRHQRPIRPSAASRRTRDRPARKS